ncbi:putative nuclease HARBI1 isoform X2 [Diabrotica virgifera virgifera]|uniref:DDE Tnp4 domain-containing protein n=1 Tax=Diabrotica virgifera virgifera TaxID=50390 RepID=A0ABM5K7W8_DIAVI|nr:putative nuclease HARBI1 isoform X2 [Diabrotica virgifera virgifera]
MSDVSDHFSSSDEDLENFLEVIEVPKNVGYFETIVPQFDDDLYFQHFRMSRGLTNQLAERFAASQYYNEQVGDSEKVTPLKFLMVFLWYIGNEAESFRNVGDRFNLTKSTVFKVVRRVSYFLSNLAPEVIKWPRNEEKVEIEQHFSEHDLPGVIGVIDGTHIKIDKPAEDPDSYLNRKHFFSIQVQVVCDHRRKIRDIFLGYPGSVHDSRVLRNSQLFHSLEEKCGDKYIIGDSGYPCLRHLLTPFRDNGHLTRRQRNYNYIVSKNRYVIEHCFGVMKQKFRQLYHVKIKNMEDISHLIRACAILHNLCLDEQLPEEEDNMPEIVNVGDVNGAERDDGNGVMKRNDVMNRLRFVL